MWSRRLIYAAVLGFVALFFVCFDGYLSYYVLLLTLFFPLISLLCSLPGLFGVRIRVSLQPEEARKGAAVTLRVEAVEQGVFPSGRIRLTVRAHNALTGEEWEERLLLTAGARPVELRHELRSLSAGRVLCGVKKARVCDLAGLFALPMPHRPREESVAVFYPVSLSPKLQGLEPQLPRGEEENLFAPRPGEDPSELFGLRDYREGDRASRIHWKLSEKTGQTLVKEMGLPLEKQPLLLLELNGTGREHDALLDVFCTLSSRLLERGLPHRAGFLAGPGELGLVFVPDERALRPALSALLLQGLPGALPALSSRELPPDISQGVYLTCRPGAAPLAALHSYPGARVSVVQVTEAAPIEDAQEGTYRVRPGFLEQDLKDLPL